MKLTILYVVVVGAFLCWLKAVKQLYPNDGSFATLAAIRLASSRQHAAVPGQRMSAARANLPT